MVFRVLCDGVNTRVVVDQSVEAEYADNETTFAIFGHARAQLFRVLRALDPQTDGLKDAIRRAHALRKGDAAVMEPADAAPTPPAEEPTPAAPVKKPRRRPARKVEVVHDA